MIHAFTSAAPNYLGKVRTLCESVRDHFPEITLHFAVADREQDLVDLEEEDFDEIIFATELKATKNPGWLFSHSIVELSTAIKAAMALQLLDRKHCELVLYFDPDLVFFSPIDELIETLRASSIVLTPHLIEPETDPKAIVDNKICALRHGVFNLGFIGINNNSEGRRFTEWWLDRVTRYCRDELEAGLFTDQKWVDLAPGYFDGVRILRSPRFNVAPWNVTKRHVAGSFDVGFTVNGDPLAFYHFTGFDSGAHEVMVNGYAPNNSSIRMLIEWYKRRTAALSPADPIPWSLGQYDDGTSIEQIHRVIYRNRSDLQQAFPNPYVTDARDGTYLKWLELNGPIEDPDKLT